MGVQQMDDTSRAAYAKRRQKLRELVRQRGLDALLVCRAPNRFYLSGFELHDPQPNESAGCLVITADGNDWLFTDSRYAMAAEMLWPVSRIRIHAGDTATALRPLLASCGAKIGVESNGISWDLARKLAAAGPDFRAALVPANGLVESLRTIKEPCEIEALRKSFRLNHALLEHLEKEIAASRPQEISEKELAWEIERFFRENGAQELAFASIVASGRNAAMPHAIPTAGAMGSNVPLLVDIGCRVDNYCSDQTRTYWLGAEMSQEFAETIDLVRKAQKAAMKIMRPGAPCRDVYKAARDVFASAGVEKYFNHGLGHGVGLETHEAPSLSGRSSQKLRSGMTVTVEPGLYYPQWGGVRWEHTVFVTDTGIEVF